MRGGYRKWRPFIDFSNSTSARASDCVSRVTRNTPHTGTHKARIGRQAFPAVRRVSCRAFPGSSLSGRARIGSPDSRDRERCFCRCLESSEAPGVLWFFQFLLHYGVSAFLSSLRQQSSLFHQLHFSYLCMAAAFKDIVILTAWKLRRRESNRIPAGIMHTIDKSLHFLPVFSVDFQR